MQPCSYWDGERKVDPELRVVVVEDSCAGECLVRSKCCQGMNDEFEWREDCLWEHLAPDEVIREEEPYPVSQQSGTKKKSQ